MPTITEHRYTRCFVLGALTLMVGLLCVLISVLLAGLAAVAATGMAHTLQTASMVSVAFATVLITHYYAITERGLWHRFWTRVGGDIPFVLTDVDPDELVDGPVEVEQ